MSVLSADVVDQAAASSGAAAAGEATDSQVTILSRVGYFGVSGDEFEENFDGHLHSLEEAAQHHLTNLVRQVLQQEDLSNDWEEIIVGLALRVVNEIHTHASDKMDIRHYVKVKKVPGGSKYDSEYVDGVLFRKNVVHKKMRAQFEGASVLLLGCPIEYHRIENQLSSFEILLKQEFDFLKLQVARVAEHRPDVIFVEKSVSRIAQELIHGENISLVVNVKRTIMERLSRSTESPILNTVD